MFMVKRFAFLSALCLLGGSCAFADQATQVLFITPDDNPAAAWPTISALCDLYGLTCARCSPEQAIDMQTALAAIVDASVPDVGRLWKSLRDAHVPILILSTGPGRLSAPRAVDVLSFTRVAKELSSWQVTQESREVTRELTAVSATIRHNPEPAIVAIDPTGPGDKLAPLLLAGSTDGTSYPVYGRLRGTESPAFVAAFSHPVREDGYVFGPCDDASLLSVIPLLTFLRFAGGEHCWHRDIDYANLTIDDPCLREPYGYLSYPGLLTQMQKAHFHTTIAFIPWNYDRSHEDVVKLFREHPEHYSICIHGNNHDRWEFYLYETSATDPMPAKPFESHEANIRQGLARMARFRQLTGLDFDPVMVFPHYVPPQRTFGLLKSYNLLMTVNATHIPLRCDPPPDPILYLRSITLDFGNFASASRHPRSDWSRASVALDLFLDNPVLFFEHEGFFRRGIDAFNPTAGMVNALQPSTRWAGLGDIARRSYLHRARPDGDCDVKAFCRDIDLTNDGAEEVTYYVEKEETADPPVRHVRVDGADHPYTMTGDHLRLTVIVPTHQTRRIDIEYEDHFQLARVDIAKNDRYVNRLRALADFRDCTLARNAVTRPMVDFYYATGLYRLGLKRAGGLCLAVTAGAGIGGWKLLRLMRQRARRRKLKIIHTR
jgi:hypothetical protein